MLSTYDLRTAGLVVDDITLSAEALMPKESPVLSWLGWRGIAKDVLHGYAQDFLLPNYIVASTAVNSATAATGVTINGLGTALTVGTILENESAAPEWLRVTSIAGPNSILLARNYDGSGVGSLAVGARLRVQAPASLEGADHDNAHTQRLGTLAYNTVGYYTIRLKASGSQTRYQSTYGSNSYEDAIAAAVKETLWATEKELLVGVLNSANSLGAEGTEVRTMKGIRGHLTSVVNSIATASLAANAHLYIGNAFQTMFENGANPNETWGLVVGPTLFRTISDLNDSTNQTAQTEQAFQRRVTTYNGPFGTADVMLSRALKTDEGLFISRDRVRPIVATPWHRQTMGKTGDNEKDMLVGEFTVEVHHESAQGRIIGL